jgi:hypothetical protein
MLGPEETAAPEQRFPKHVSHRLKVFEAKMGVYEVCWEGAPKGEMTYRTLRGSQSLSHSILMKPEQARTGSQETRLGRY